MAYRSWAPETWTTGLALIFWEAELTGSVAVGKDETPGLMLTHPELSTESILRKYMSWLSRHLTQHLRPSW